MYSPPSEKKKKKAISTILSQDFWFYLGVTEEKVGVYKVHKLRRGRRKELKQCLPQVLAIFSHLMTVACSGLSKDNPEVFRRTVAEGSHSSYVEKL